MSQVTVTRLVPSPAAEVWEALADFGGIHRFHPGVQRSPIVNDTPRGPGATRTCYFYGGGEATEQVVSLTEGESMVVDVLSGPLPFEDVRAIFSVAPAGDQETHVTIEMDFRADPGPSLDALRAQLGGLLGGILRGLETHLETGALIGPGGAP